MSTEALEFVAPLNVTATNFNRNPRKLHLLQMDFGEGLLPIVLGTYPVNPITGAVVPWGNPFYPAPNKRIDGIAGLANGATFLDTSALTTDVRIYKLIASSDTATSTFFLKWGASNKFRMDFLNALDTRDFDLSPEGWSFADTILGAGSKISDNNITIGAAGVTKIFIWGLAFQQ